jgi:hypothetical protein
VTLARYRKDVPPQQLLEDVGRAPARHAHVAAVARPLCAGASHAPRGCRLPNPGTRAMSRHGSSFPGAAAYPIRPTKLRVRGIDEDSPGPPPAAIIAAPSAKYATYERSPHWFPATRQRTRQAGPARSTNPHSPPLARPRVPAC